MMYMLKMGDKLEVFSDYYLDESCPHLSSKTVASTLRVDFGVPDDWHKCHLLKWGDNIRI